MLILGIETSCDETSVALVQNGQDVLSNIIASQIDIHAATGGIGGAVKCPGHRPGQPAEHAHYALP